MGAGIGRPKVVDGGEGVGTGVEAGVGLGVGVGIGVGVGADFVEGLIEDAPLDCLDHMNVVALEDGAAVALNHFESRDEGD